MDSKTLSWKSADHISIVDTLASLGHFPTKISKKEAWFLSPLRSETQASFKVSLVKNLWYDFGIGKGGNVIDLVKLLLDCSYHGALRFLSGQDLPLSPPPSPTLIKLEKESEVVVIDSSPVNHMALLQYLTSRKIPVDIGAKYCLEVHYQLKGKDYFSLGLKNNLGGWELRNKYSKISSSPKSYTYFENDSRRLIILEGMFDFLSLATLEKELVNTSDCIVLNSLAFISKIEELIPNYQEVNLYLDNDTAGKKAATALLESHPQAIDNSAYYKEHIDLNDYLQNNK